MAKKYKYFAHRDCEYFPCHEGADENDFNCLFCYCPLYMLGEDCGGDFIYRKDGIKDCTPCIFPHLMENYDAVKARFPEILDKMRKT